MTKSFRCAAVLLTALVAAPSAVYAHAGLLGAEPADETTVAVTPNVLRLHFSEQIEPAFSQVVVTDADGKRGDTGTIRPDADHPGWVDVPLAAPLHGRCEVRWRAVSVDTHVTKGEMAFIIGK